MHLLRLYTVSSVSVHPSCAYKTFGYIYVDRIPPSQKTKQKTSAWKGYNQALYINCILTVNLICKQFSVDHEVWVEEHVAYLEPVGLLVLVVDGLTYHTKTSHHNEQNDQEVTHLS